MSKVYDVFADEYIDEKDKDINAPPERYIEITEEVLINNTVRWFMDEFIKADLNAEEKVAGGKTVLQPMKKWKGKQIW